MQSVKKDLLLMGQELYQSHFVDLELFYQDLIALYYHLHFMKALQVLDALSSWADFADKIQTMHLEWDWTSCLLYEHHSWIVLQSMIQSCNPVDIMSAYDDLLGYELCLCDGVLMLSESSTRKFIGGFYTPLSIVQHSIPQILPATHSIEFFKKQRICDPSCGVGHFLIEVAEYLYQHIQADFEDTEQCKKWIVENCIYGVDLDPIAVDICRQRLYLWVGKVLDTNIHQGNSLLWKHPNCDVEQIDAWLQEKSYFDSFFDWHQQFRSVFDTGGFTLMVGNPPYLFLSGRQNPVKFFKKHNRQKSQEWSELIELYTLLYPQYSKSCKNLYKWFVALLLEIQPQKMALILPNSWIHLIKYADVQMGLIKQGLYQIWDFGRQAFSNVHLDTCMIFADQSVHYSRIAYHDFRKANAFPSQGKRQYLHPQKGRITVLQHPLFVTLSQRCSQKIKDVAVLTEGSHDFSIKNANAGSHQIEVFLDKSMQKFRAPCTHRIFLSQSIHHNGFHQGLRVLLRKTGDSLVSALVDTSEVVWAHQNLYVLKSKNNFETASLQALLASSLYTFLYQSSSFGQRGRPMAQLRITGLKELPIPTISLDEHQELKRLVYQCIEYRNTIKCYHQAMASLNAFVYQLFGLSAQESQIIEAWLQS